MSNAPAPPTDPSGLGAVLPAHRQRRRENPWAKRLAWTAGGLLAAGIIAAFSLRLWVERYLKSDEFAAQLNASAGRILAADCKLDGLSWQDSAGYAGTFTAEGREAAAFRMLTVNEVRADLDLAAVWDRVWRVNQVKIAQVTADFSAEKRLAADFAEVAAEAAASSAASASAGWFQGWLPNRTELGAVQVERFDFVRRAAPGVTGWDGGGFALTLKPNLKSASVEVDGRHGEVRIAGNPRLLIVDRVRTILRREGAALDQMEGRVEDAMVTAEGTIGFQTPADSRLNIRVTGASLEKWLPEDWLKRCSGQASARAILRGDWRRPETLQAAGEFLMTDATLQALPLLDIIARKTQNASFLRMQIKDAAGKFDRRRADQWELRQLRADAPGLLRLKGWVDIGAGGTLRGSLLLGIVPGTLRYLAGAEQTVFVTAGRFNAGAGNAGELSADDAALLWTRFQLGGTIDLPSEDLSERLARAWFDATAEEVAALSMEAAATVTRTAASAAGTVLEAAPPLLERAPGLLNESVQGGLKVLDSLLPR